MFGICSILIPAGYSNDSYYFQNPHQPLTNPKETENAYLGPRAASAAVSPEDGTGIAMNATLRDGEFRLFRDLSFTTTTLGGSNATENNAVTVLPANGEAIDENEQVGNQLQG